MKADSLESALCAGEVYAMTRDILALLVSLRTTVFCLWPTCAGGLCVPWPMIVYSSIVKVVKVMRDEMVVVKRSQDDIMYWYEAQGPILPATNPLLLLIHLVLRIGSD
jgi:hypothetical protein